MHEQMAATLDTVIERMRAIQQEARSGAPPRRPRWPMIVLRTPKGWTGPKEVDGKKTEGSWRSHQVPLAEVAKNEAHRRQLEEWMKSYRPEALFDESGRLLSRFAALAPSVLRRARAGQPEARRAAREAQRALADLAARAARPLGRHRPLVVSWAGGLLADPRFRGGVWRELRGRGLRVIPTPPAATIASPEAWRSVL